MKKIVSFGLSFPFLMGTRGAVLKSVKWRMMSYEYEATCEREEAWMPNLYEMTWLGAKEYFKSNDIVLLPVGSTEQHGPHNPLGTDHLIARDLAEKAAERTRVVCLPTVPFGVSSHHRQFWGTVHVRSDVFKAYLREVCLSLKYYGVNKIVIVNGHGGNTRSLVELARELREAGMFISIFIWWRAARQRLDDVFSLEERGHAAAEETSVNLALHPRLVNMKRAVDERKRQLFPEASVGVIYGSDTIDVTDSGVMGISKTASAEKGKEIVQVAVEELVRHVNVLKKANIEDLLPEPLR